MANLTETGHAKNVANFEDLIQRLQTTGGKYMPTRNVLQLPNLQTQLQQVKFSMQAVTASLPAYTAAVDAREAVWKSLDKLVTRVCNVFKASVDNPAEVDTALSYARKIKGSGGKKSKTEGEGGEGPKKISTSQQSYDMQMQNFEQLIMLLSTHASYKPNEPDLQVTSLRSLLDNMKMRSSNVMYAKAALDNARANRDNLLYAEGVGLVDVAQGVKGYVRGGFTPGTAQYKPILAIGFKGR